MVTQSCCVQIKIYLLFLRIGTLHLNLFKLNIQQPPYKLIKKRLILQEIMNWCKNGAIVTVSPLCFEGSFVCKARIHFYNQIKFKIFHLVF